MPTYEYACRDCGEHLEVVQSFRDDPLSECPACAGRLRKVFSAAPIVFKGSGWHIKDYAPKKPADSSSSTGSKTGSSSGSTSEPGGGGSSSGSSSSEGSSGGSSSEGSSGGSSSGGSSDASEKRSA